MCPLQMGAGGRRSRPEQGRAVFPQQPRPVVRIKGLNQDTWKKTNFRIADKPRRDQLTNPMLAALGLVDTAKSPYESRIW